MGEILRQHESPLSVSWSQEIWDLGELAGAGHRLWLEAAPGWQEKNLTVPREEQLGQDSLECPWMIPGIALPGISCWKYKMHSVGNAKNSTRKLLYY